MTLVPDQAQQNTRHRRLGAIRIGTKGVARSRLMLLLLMLMLFGACQAEPDELSPVTLQLKWLHQAQFGGFYAADQQGNYADAGLAVTMLEGGPTVSPIDVVLAGKATFGLVNPEAILMARAAGKPVRAIAVIYQRNPVTFLTLPKSNIQHPKDFVGKRMSLPGDIEPILHAMMHYVGADADQIETTSDFPTLMTGTDFSPFYTGEVDILAGYVLNQGLKIMAEGYEVHAFSPDDYGIHFYGDTLFTTEEIIAEQPDLVMSFLKTSLEGWSWAIANPDKAADLVSNYRPESSLARETEFMISSTPFIHTGQEPLGWMSLEKWAAIHQIFLDQGRIGQSFPVTEAYTLEFLHQLYTE